MKKIVLVLFLSSTASFADLSDTTKFKKKVYLDLLSGYHFGGNKNTISISENKFIYDQGVNFLSVALNYQYHKNLMVGIKAEGLYLDFERKVQQEIFITSGITANSLDRYENRGYRFPDAKSLDIAGSSVNLSHTILMEISPKLVVGFELLGGLALVSGLKKTYHKFDYQLGPSQSVITEIDSPATSSVSASFFSTPNYFTSYKPNGIGIGANLGLSVFSSYELTRKVSLLVSLGYRNTNLTTHMISESGKEKFVFKNNIDYLQMNVGLRFLLKK